MPDDVEGAGHERIDDHPGEERVEGEKGVREQEIEHRQDPVVLTVAAHHELRELGALPDRAPGPAQVHPVHLPDPGRHPGVDHGVRLVADHVAGLHGQGGQGPVLAVGTAPAQEPLVEPSPDDPGQEHPPVGGQGPGTADDSPVDALVAPAEVEGQGVAHGQHPGQEVLLLVEHSNPPGHGRGLPVPDERQDDVPDSRAVEPAVGVQADDDLSLGRPEPFVEGPPLPPVLFEPDDLEAPAPGLPGFFHGQGRPICGPVVDTDDLELLPGIPRGEGRPDRGSDHLLLVQGADYDRDRGPVHLLLALPDVRLIQEPEDGLDRQPDEGQDQGENEGIRYGPEKGASSEEYEPELEDPEFDSQCKDSDAPEENQGDSNRVHILPDSREKGRRAHFQFSQRDKCLHRVYGRFLFSVKRKEV